MTAAQIEALPVTPLEQVRPRVERVRTTPDGGRAVALLTGRDPSETWSVEDLRSLRLDPDVHQYLEAQPEPPREALRVSKRAAELVEWHFLELPRNDLLRATPISPWALSGRLRGSLERVRRIEGETSTTADACLLAEPPAPGGRARAHDVACSPQAVGAAYARNLLRRPHPNATTDLADILQHAGREPEAVAVLRPAAARWQNAAVALSVLRQVDDPDEAIRVLLPWMKDSNVARRVIDVMLRNDRIDDAIALLEGQLRSAHARSRRDEVDRRHAGRSSAGRRPVHGRL